MKETVFLQRERIIGYVCKDGTVFENSNFSQMAPGTKIFEGVKGLVFKSGCNLQNCIVPPDAIVEPGCFTIQQVVIDDPPPVQKSEIEGAIEQYGKEAILDKIGIEDVKKYFNLKE